MAHRRDRRGDAAGSPHRRRASGPWRRWWMVLTLGLVAGLLLYLFRLL
jgi:hypothetical protein